MHTPKCAAPYVVSYKPILSTSSSERYDTCLGEKVQELEGSAKTTHIALCTTPSSGRAYADSAWEISPAVADMGLLPCQWHKPVTSHDACRSRCQQTPASGTWAEHWRSVEETAIPKPGDYLATGEHIEFCIEPLPQLAQDNHSCVLVIQVTLLCWHTIHSSQSRLCSESWPMYNLHATNGRHESAYASVSGTLSEPSYRCRAARDLLPARHASDRG